MTKIYVTGYPKSGTSWLCRLLGDALDSPVGAIDPDSTSNAVATEGQHRKGNHYIGQGHAIPVYKGEQPPPGVHTLVVEDLMDEKIIVIMRDPRDIIVSGSYYWGRSISECIPLAAEGVWPMPGGGLVEFYRAWFDSGLAHCITRYEWLHQRKANELRTILDALGIEDFGILEEVWSRQSFRNRKKWTEEHGDALNYGRDWQLAFLRKGIIGDWKNHFTDDDIKLCDKYFGEFMREMDMGICSYI